MAQSITLQTSDSDIVSSDVLGRLSFAASSESSGSDAVLIGASIYAMAESNFTEISNATSIIFATASSESAIAKLKISSQGHFLPILDKTYDIGASGTKFRNVFAENGKFENISISNLSDPYEILYITDSSGNVSSTDLLKVDVANTEIDLGGDLIPTSNLAYDLGSSSYKFRDTYTDKVILNSGSAIPATTSNTVYNVSGELYYNNNVVALLPSGGVQGQILQKYSTTSNILEWIDNFATEVRVYVKNTTGSALTKGQAVYINGAQGDHPTIALAIADGESSSSKTLGLLKQNLAINEFGYVIAEGGLDGIDTSAASAAGDLVYLSPTTPGGLVYGLANKPTAPNHMVFIGYVVVKQQNNGKIFIKVQNGFELGELHDVATNGTANGTFLQYNTASGLWLASTSGNFTTLQLNGTTVSVSGHTHTSSDITNFNTAVSGLLPTIANSGDNRILTSTGSSVGINAEANLTFDGTNLNLNNQTASTIASFDSSKNLVSLATATYPSLTELSYVKGVTSALQTQIDTKAATSTTITAGSGLAGGGSLVANRTIDIGQGDGITVSADSIAVDSTVIRTTGTQTITGNKTISVSTGVGLTITNTGTSNSFVVNDQSGDPTPFVIDAGGNVGIKATSTASSLNVVGNSAFYQDANGTPSLGSKNFYCATFENFSAGYGLAIGGVNTSTGSTLIQGQSFVSSVAYDLLLQPLGGNVGIGTTSPSYRLHLEQSGSASTVLSSFLQPSLTTGNFNQIYFGRTGASHDCGTITYSTNATAANSTLSLGLYGTSFTLNVNGNGNVGIGTTNPTEKLHIRGAGARAYIYNTTTDAVVIIQGLTPASPWLGSGKSACQIDVDGWGGFAWQTDVTSGAKLFKLINNGGYGASESTFLTVNTSGDVLIGTATDQGNFKLQVAGNTYLENLYLSTTTNWGRLAINHAGATTFAAGWNNTDTSSTGQTTLNILRNGVSVGTITTTNAATSYNTTSDYRLKANPRPITNATERIARIKPSQWDWHVGGVGEGFIAHELVDAVPLAVTGEKDAVDATGNPVWQTVDMSKVVPVLVAALQEANARIAALEQRINA